jgi:hypothetical protein
MGAGGEKIIALLVVFAELLHCITVWAFVRQVHSLVAVLFQVCAPDVIGCRHVRFFVSEKAKLYVDLLPRF